jgi:hypothetical protein
VEKFIILPKLFPPPGAFLWLRRADPPGFKAYSDAHPGRLTTCLPTGRRTSLSALVVETTPLNPTAAPERAWFCRKLSLPFLQNTQRFQRPYCLGLIRLSLEPTKKALKSRSMGEI